MPGAYFGEEHSHLCGTIQTINSSGYKLESGTIIYSLEDSYFFVGENAIRRLAKDVNVSEFKHAQDEIMKILLQGAINVPEGYEFRDENGKVIEAKMIVLEKKKPKYPKSYKECCEVLGLDTMGNDASGYKHELIIRFQELLIARDAYWKLAGDWKPEFGGEPYYCIKVANYKVDAKAGFNGLTNCTRNTILAFPTEETRDAFYETFKVLIEECKELL